MFQGDRSRGRLAEASLAGTISSLTAVAGRDVAELAAAVGKSKATVSKYEKGEITVDVVALYDLADALRVHVEQLLCRRPVEARRRLVQQQDLGVHRDRPRNRRPLFLPA